MCNAVHSLLAALDWCVFCAFVSFSFVRFFLSSAWMWWRWWLVLFCTRSLLFFYLFSVWWWLLAACCIMNIEQVRTEIHFSLLENKCWHKSVREVYAGANNLSLFYNISHAIVAAFIAPFFACVLGAVPWSFGGPTQILISGPSGWNIQISLFWADFYKISVSKNIESKSIKQFLSVFCWAKTALSYINAYFILPKKWISTIIELWKKYLFWCFCEPVWPSLLIFRGRKRHQMT